MNQKVAILWVGALVALVGYLITAAKPPVAWSYMEWLQFAAFILAWISGKLMPTAQERQDR